MRYQCRIATALRKERLTSPKTHFALGRPGCLVFICDCVCLWFSLLRSHCMVQTGWIPQSTRMAFETFLSSLRQHVWSIDRVPAACFRTLAWEGTGGLLHCPGGFESLWAPGQGSWMSGIPTFQNPSLSAIPEKDPGTFITAALGEGEAGRAQLRLRGILAKLVLYHKLQRRAEHCPLLQNHCPSIPGANWAPAPPLRVQKACYNCFLRFLTSR